MKVENNNDMTKTITLIQDGESVNIKPAAFSYVTVEKIRKNNRSITKVTYVEERKAINA